MKTCYFITFCFCSALLFSQENTDIFLFDLEINNSKIELKNGKNISNNIGYDNQPSFLDDRYIVFASTRNNQTEIAKYDTRSNAKIFINETEGGEYTPLKIQNTNAISAVRLDKDGKQRLYKYNLSNGESTELIKDLVVAYYTWFNENTIVSAVIEGDDLNLYVNNLKENWNQKYASKVGRSFHKIPNSNLVSFISKENENHWLIKSLNPFTGEIKVIANTLSNVEDICWLNAKTLLCGKANKLYKLTLNKDNNWVEVANLASYSISNITRLAVDKASSKLVIAAALSSNETSDNTTTTNTQNEASNTTTNQNSSTTNSEIEAIVQRNLDAYNARNIDAFMQDYAEDIKLYSYPNTLQTEGKTEMRKSYANWFKNTADLRAFIKKRIIIGNKVIDEEQITANGKVFNAVAIYEIEN